MNKLSEHDDPRQRISEIFFGHTSSDWHAIIQTYETCVSSLKDPYLLSWERAYLSDLLAAISPQDDAVLKEIIEHLAEQQNLRSLE